MDSQIEELKELVRRNIEITKETRETVHKMQRRAHWSTILRWAWRLFILGAFAFGYYYFILPYIQSVMELYNSVRGGAEQSQTWMSQFADFFKNFGQ